MSSQWRRPTLSVAVLSAAVGCSGGASHVGDFEAVFDGPSLRWRAEEAPDASLLEAFAGEGAYAAVATRAGRAKFELQYGSFRITEGDDPWSSATRFELTAARPGKLTAQYLDDAGEPLAELEADAPADGVLRLVYRATREGHNRVSLAFACAPQERFVGFGAQADGIDHRGHTVQVWTSEPGIGKSDQDTPGPLWMLEGTRHASSMGLPTWLSSRGFLAVVQSDARSVFELCSVRNDAFRVETWAPTLTLWLFYGPRPAQALERATAHVLGRPARPPPLAFAPWLDAIHGSAEVRRVAALLRSEGIASSALWTEDFRGGADVPGQGYRLKEEWDLDRALYPDAEALAAELRAQGFAWLAYFNTFLVQGTRVYDEAVEGQHLVRAPEGGPYLFSGVTFKPTGLADLSRPETREWVKGYLRRALDLGFDGWMADYGEWLPHDAVLHSGEDPLLAHNRYPHDWAQLNREVLDERASDGRQRLFFSRAGWLGTGAVSPVFWAGDQRTSFQRDDGLPTVIPLGLNLGLAGVSTYGHDIAGYQSSTNPPSTKELFFRWTTLGALSPVMRTHHGLSARDNWRFDQDAETLAHFRRWAGFHLRLFPYLDGGAAEAERSGLPLMRMLPLAFPDFAEGWTVADTYLLGPNLLVAPVVEEGATRRTVSLPPGRWWPVDGGASLDGPTEVEVDAPLTEAPLFGRAGGVVPLLPEGVQTLLPTADDAVTDLDDADGARVLWVFSGAAGEFYERDGTRYRLLLRPGGPAQPTEGDAALSPCADAEQRGCYVDDGRVRKVRLSGVGPLAWAGHRLEVNGAHTRRLEVWIYGP